MTSSTPSGGNRQSRRHPDAPKDRLTSGEWLTFEAALEAFPQALTSRYLRRLVAERKIPVSRPGSGSRLFFRRADLEHFFRSGLSGDAA